MLNFAVGKVPPEIKAAEAEILKALQWQANTEASGYRVSCESEPTGDRFLIRAWWVARGSSPKDSTKYQVAVLLPHSVLRIGDESALLVIYDDIALRLLDRLDQARHEHQMLYGDGSGTRLTGQIRGPANLADVRC